MSNITQSMLNQMDDATWHSDTGEHFPEGTEFVEITESVKDSATDMVVFKIDGQDGLYAFDTKAELDEQVTPDDLYMVEVVPDTTPGTKQGTTYALIAELGSDNGLSDCE